MDKASRANVTKDSIKKAIDKGMGTIDGADYQGEVRYEGMVRRCHSCFLFDG